MTAPGAGYRAEIDGLRAVAVVAVVLFHLGFRWIPGGFVGVDVFFVISGFLITGILLGELQTGTFSFRGFWARRILRIFPALLVTVVATLAAAWFVSPRSDHPAIGQQAVAALLSVANLWFWRNSCEYWGQAAEISPLLHTWSLSVEEQFYLCFQLLLWAIAARAGRFLPLLLAAAGVASFGYFLAGIRAHGFEAMFYLLPSRAWELGLGCCLATVPQWQGRGVPLLPAAVRSGLAVAGLALIVAACGLPPGRTRAVVAAVLGAGCVLAWGSSGPCRAVLAWPPVVAIGKASYSIYLWHWPVIVMARLLDESRGVATGAAPLVLVTGVLATASYRFVETPTRRERRSLPFIAAGYAVALVAACAMALSSGSYDTSGFEPPTSTSGSYNLGRAVRTRANAHLLPRGVTAALPDGGLRGGIIAGDAAAPQVVVLGDSHGTMWCHAIRGVTEKLGVTTSFYCAQGASPFVHVLDERPMSFTVEEKRAFDEARLEHIARWKPAVVVICARWDAYREGDARELLTFLDAHAGRVLLVEQVPEVDVAEGRDVLPWLCFKGIEPADGVRRFLPEANVEKYEEGRRMIRALAAAHPACEVVPTQDLYTEGQRVLVLDGRRVVYEDNDHLTDYGTSLAVERIEAAIGRALPDGGSR